MKNSHVKSGFVLSYVSIGVQSVISIVYTPVMLRFLGQSDYGLLQIAMSAIAHLGILSFGFSGSYLRFYSSYRTSGDKKAIASLNGMYAAIFTAVSLVVLLAGFTVTSCADMIFSASMSTAETERLRLLLGIMTVNLALSFPCSVFDAYITAHEQFTFQKSLVILTAFLNPMLTFPLLLIGRGSAAVAVCMTLITFIKLVVSGFYCIKKLRMKFAFYFDTALFKRLCSFSFFVFLNIVSDQVNWNAGNTILGIVSGSDEVTLYSLGMQFNTYFLTFSYALSSLFAPKAYRIAVNDRAAPLLHKLFARFGRLQLAVMGYIFLMLVAVGKPFMRMWSGLDSDVPYYTALVLIAPILITSTQSIAIEIQRAKDMHRFRSVLYILIAAVNIAISIPLSLRFGAVGCAVGTCVCLVTGNIVIMNIYNHTRVGLNMKRFWTELLKLLPAFVLPAVCAAFLHSFTGAGIWSIAASALILTAVYAPSVWFLGVRKDIKRIPSA